MNTILEAIIIVMMLARAIVFVTAGVSAGKRMGVEHSCVVWLGPSWSL
ncbi:hypothetical protein [Nocardia xishanensis]